MTGNRLITKKYGNNQIDYFVSRHKIFSLPAYEKIFSVTDSRSISGHRDIIYSKDLIEGVEDLCDVLVNAIDDGLRDKTISFYLNPNPHVNRMKKMLSLPPIHEHTRENTKVLEIGSGIGTNCLLCKAMSEGEMFGIEPAPGSYQKLIDCIHLLQEGNPHLPYNAIEAGAESLPFSDNTFDFIYSFEVMEHVMDPKKMLEEIYRVLKPGGLSYITTCNYDSFYEGHYGRFWNPFIGKQGNRKRYIRKHLSPKFLSELNFITKKQIKQWVNEIHFSSIIFNPKSTWNYLQEYEIGAVYPAGYHLPELSDVEPCWLHKTIESRKVARFLSLFDRDYKMYFLLEK